MKLFNRKSFFWSLLIISSLNLSCKNNGDNFDEINVDATVWLSYLDDLGIQTSLDNTLTLISYPTYCGDCLSELSGWNQLINDLDEFEIVLIIVDRFSSNAEYFVSSNNFNFSAFTDTAAIVLEKELIPAIPKKVYFQEQKIVLYNRIGDKPSFNEAVEMVKLRE